MHSRVLESYQGSVSPSVSGSVGATSSLQDVHRCHPEFLEREQAPSIMATGCLLVSLFAGLYMSQCLGTSRIYSPVPVKAATTSPSGSEAAEKLLASVLDGVFDLQPDSYSDSDSDSDCSEGNFSVADGMMSEGSSICDVQDGNFAPDYFMAGWGYLRTVEYSQSRQEPPVVHECVHSISMTEIPGFGFQNPPPPRARRSSPMALP